MKFNMKVLIAAAGTAGHINPAIAIANKIKKEEKDSKIIFLGTTRGLENDLVPRAGYELKHIEAYGLSKKISLENINKMRKTIGGIFEAKKIIQEFKPDIVIGTGGYICGAAVIAASLNKIPVLLHESNAFPGKATKMLSKKANTVLVSFEEAKNKITNCKNVVYTGTPVKVRKRDFSKIEKIEIIKSLGLSDEKSIILVFGGSQGAKKINEALLYLIENKKINNYQIIWATGPKQYDIIKQELQDKNISINNIKGCKIMPYIYNMEEIENIADLIVARSGAMTITEIANLAKPSILIPLPNVSNDHQMYNAKVLQAKEAAIIIKNDELTGEVLNKTIEDIILDREKCKMMGQNAFKVSSENVEDKIYDEIKKLINK